MLVNSSPFIINIHSAVVVSVQVAVVVPAISQLTSMQILEVGPGSHPQVPSKVEGPLVKVIPARKLHSGKSSAVACASGHPKTTVVASGSCMCGLVYKCTAVVHGENFVGLDRLGALGLGTDGGSGSEKAYRSRYRCVGAPPQQVG